MSRKYTSPAREYRSHLRFGCVVFASKEAQQVLLGKRVSQLTMDELEAYANLLRLKPQIPDGYRNRRIGACHNQRP